MHTEPTTSRTQVLALLATSLVFSLVLAETLLRIFVPPSFFLDPDSNISWQTKLAEAQKQQPAANAPASDTVYDARLGWRMKPNYSASGVTHNSRGFRSAHETSDKPEGLRILTLGDSFTYGLGVKDDETYSAYLAKATEAEVINAGVNAYGIDQAFLRWEQEGSYLQPELVVLGYYVDDFLRNMLFVRDRPKPHFVYDPATNDIQLKGVPVPDTASFITQKVSTVRANLRSTELLNWVKFKVLQKQDSFYASQLQEGVILNEHILRRLKDSVTASQAKFIVAIIGNCEDQLPLYNFIEQSVIESCSKTELECINIAEAMRKHDYQSFYGSNCHFSSKGNEFTANKIAEAIRHIDERAGN